MKTIPNYSLYCADENGNIYSTNYKRTGKTKIIKPCITGGYLQSMFLRDDGKYCTRKIHYLITLAFFGEREIGIEVNHKDGNKMNNSISNLEYCTKSENIKHSVINGLQRPRVGSLNGMAKLNEEQVREIRLHAANSGRNYGRKALAEKYNVSECTIKEVVTRRKNKFYNA